MAVIKFLVFLLLALFLAFIAARLIGSRPSWRRSLVVGCVGIVTGAFIGSEAFQQGYRQNQPLIFSDDAPTFFTVAPVAIMLIFVALELLGGTGLARRIQRRGVGIPHPV